MSVGRKLLSSFVSGVQPAMRSGVEPIKLVLLRHGESEWNASKRFSGWVDIDLTDKGRRQVILLGFSFDGHNILETMLPVSGGACW